MDVYRAAFHRGDDSPRKVGARQHFGQPARIDRSAFGRIDVAHAHKDRLVRCEAGSQAGVPQAERPGKREPSQVVARRALGRVDVGVGVKPDNDGVGPVGGDDRKCRERHRAASHDADRPRSLPKDAFIAAAHGDQVGSRQLQLDVPRLSGGGAAGAYRVGEGPQAHAQRAGQQMGGYHRSVVAVPGSARVMRQRNAVRAHGDSSGRRKLTYKPTDAVPVGKGPRPLRL